MMISIFVTLLQQALIEFGLTIRMHHTWIVYMHVHVLHTYTHTHIDALCLQ